MTMAAKNDSDLENDSDYAPPPDADEESCPSDDEKPDTKRARAEPSELSAEEEEARKKALWADFQASVNESSSAVVPPPPTLKLVKIEKRYRFAGEEVIEVVEVPEDSPDASKWPIWCPPSFEEEVRAASAPSLASPASAEKKKRPGPRKPKTQLAEPPPPPVLARATMSKAKKLTTLDKSVMDWKAHVHSPENVALQDELEANRRGGGGVRGGGYLDKVDFLRRVEERKEVVLEAAKGSKRRRT